MPVEAARPATSADIESLLGVFTAAATELHAARGADIYLIREAQTPTHDELAGWITDASTYVVAGTLDDAVVGAAVATTEMLADGSTLGLIKALYVEAEARQVGVGEELLKAVVDWCASRGASSVDSLALPGERATKNFYEAAGFKARLLTVHHRIERGGPS